ncbi:MAG: SRPBCC domain-containing protein [Bacteroidota bacterium]
MRTTLIIKKRLKIKADKTAVWNALTNPNWPQQDMQGAEVISTWKIGAPVTWKSSSGDQPYLLQGEVLDIIEGQYLQFTNVDRQVSGEPNFLVVTYTLHEEGRETELTSIIESVDGAVRKFSPGQYAWMNNLNTMKSLLELAQADRGLATTL